MAKKRLSSIEMRDLIEQSDDECGSDNDFLENFDMSGEEEIFDQGETIAELDVNESSGPVDIDLEEVDIPLPALVWYPEKDNEGCSESFKGENKVNVTGKTPLEYFLFFFDNEMLKMITEETNRYALQNNSSFCTNIDEIRIFLGISLVMSYIKYPRIRMYWEAKSGLRCYVIANSMPLYRFEKIRSFLHFTNNDEISMDNKDKAIRIRPFLDRLNESFKKACEPGEALAVDEMLIPFKGRSSLKSYLPKKPKKWGFKMWCLAGTNGYIHKFELYQGANVNEVQIVGVNKCGNVVIRLCSDILGKFHKIYADNLFTSLSLAQYLRENDTLYVGTLRPNLLNEAARKLKSEKVLKKEGRGSSSIVTSNNNVSVVRWYDNKCVHLLSTYVGIGQPEEVRRYCRKTKRFIEVVRPAIVKEYNKSMGGVDLMDSLVALYRNYPTNRRWYIRIFYHMLNVSAVNAWILWKEMHPSDKKELLEFKSEIANALIFCGSNR